MRTKNKNKNKKRKPAYRRGEKLAIYLKRGTIVLIAVVIISSLVLGVKLLTRQFSLDEIIVSGNYHLDKEDIVKSMNIKKGNLLLDISSSDINDRLRENPWIKSVALKKQLPGTILIKVKEASPKALLSIKKKLYIIDEDGRILERIKGESTPFLPVIKEISPKNEKDMKEALKLIDSLTEKNMLNSRESVEIGVETYGLFMNMDGEIIKVGYGGYSKKFERWLELEPEIRKRGVSIKYIDLRFKDSVIVKPVKTIKRKSS